VAGLDVNGLETYTQPQGRAVNGFQ
jgi:hypothetical protein